jgi:hypothetical protein
VIGRRKQELEAYLNHIVANIPPLLRWVVCVWGGVVCVVGACKSTRYGHTGGWPGFSHAPIKDSSHTPTPPTHIHTHTTQLNPQVGGLRRLPPPDCAGRAHQGHGCRLRQLPPFLLLPLLLPPGLGDGWGVEPGGGGGLREWGGREYVCLFVPWCGYRKKMGGMDGRLRW